MASERIHTSFCKLGDLLTLLGMGEKIARCILQRRDDLGNLTIEELSDIPDIKHHAAIIERVNIQPDADRPSPSESNTQYGDREDETLHIR